MKTSSFTGQVAIITGGASGIGLALARRLVGAGAHVTIADIDEDLACASAGSIAAGHAGAGAITARHLDVSDRAAVQRLVEEVTDRHGRIDLLFNNAGISMGGPTHELTGSHWDRVIDIDLRGVVNGILAVYPGMVERGSGHIVNTASGVGLVAPPFVAPYAAAKHAVVGLSTGLRPEAALHGVRVTVLCPGAVETPILDRPPEPDLPTTPSAPVTARQYLTAVGQRPIDADDFARRALHAIARDKGIVVLPRRAAALWHLYRISPALAGQVNRLVARRVQRLVRPR